MAKKNLKYQSPGINEETRFEKLHTVNFESSQEASKLIAREICDLVKSKQEKNKSCVIGFCYWFLTFNSLSRNNKDS